MKRVAHKDTPLTAWVAPSFNMPDWMLASRRHYFSALQQQGFPTRREEQFRYTDLSLIEKQLLDSKRDEAVVTSLSINLPDKISTDSIRLVFRNHHFQPTLSDLEWLPEGVIACDLQQAVLHHEELLKKTWPINVDVIKQPFSCLSLATFNDGFFFYIPKNVVFTKPVHLLYIIDDAASAAMHDVHIVSLGDNSQLALIEEMINSYPGTVFSNHTQILSLQQHAKLEQTLLYNTHPAALNWRHTHLAMEEHSYASCVSFLMGGQFTRHDVNGDLQKPFAHCKTSGYYHAKKTQYIDNHIDIQHTAPHTQSDMLFKGTLQDQATVVFNGRLYVEQQAQKIKAEQANHHLLFSPQASSYVKPELEIYADDVKCKHGATTAAFDKEAIFYLCSRGLTEEAAKKLLLEAFLQSILDRVLLPNVFIEHIKGVLGEVMHDL